MFNIICTCRDVFTVICASVPAIKLDSENIYNSFGIWSIQTFEQTNLLFPIES